MEKTTLKHLYLRGIVTAISILRFNKSSYPYVTLLHGNKSQNVYFGKNSAKVIGAEFAEGDNIINRLKNADIVMTTNAGGEERFKISLPSETSGYASQAEMDDVFGEVEIAADFDINKFEKLFTSREEVSDTNIPDGTVKPEVKKVLETVN